MSRTKESSGGENWFWRAARVDSVVMGFGN